VLAHRQSIGSSEIKASGICTRRTGFERMCTDFSLDIAGLRMLASCQTADSLMLVGVLERCSLSMIFVNITCAGVSLTSCVVLARQAVIPSLCFVCQSEQDRTGCVEA
jgi:hypothetical protein